jgi:putative iron-only hydrogenase system regulator
MRYDVASLLSADSKVFLQVFMEKRLGFIGIIIQNRAQVVENVNRLLSDAAEMILARTGLPHSAGNCSVITLIVHASTDQVGRLTGQLGMLPGVSVKSGLSKIAAKS